MPTVKLTKRVCQHAKCQKVFRPKRENQEYCNKTCKNRAAQERLRWRAKMNGKER